MGEIGISIIISIPHLGGTLSKKKYKFNTIVFWKDKFSIILRMIISKHQKIAIMAGNDMSQIFLKLCVYFPYVQ